MNILDFILQDKELNTFINRLSKSKKSLITGINIDILVPILKAILQTNKSPLLLIEENEDRAQRLQGELENVLDDGLVESFPIDTILVTQNSTVSNEELKQRINALSLLLSKKSGIIIATPQALQFPLSSPEIFSNAKKKLQVDTEYNLKELIAWLVSVGYRRDSMIVNNCEFAMRGDILDIFPINASSPIRIEFFGDEVDTIKEFDLDTQRSKKNLESIEISPAVDRIFSAEDFQRASKKLQTDLDESIVEEKDLKENFDSTLSDFKAKILPQNYAFLIDYLLENPSSLLDYLSPSGLVLFDNWTAIQKSIIDSDQQNEAFISQEIKKGQMLDSQKLRKNFAKTIKNFKQNEVFISLFQKGMGRLKFDQLVNVTSREPLQFFSQMPLIKSELKAFKKSKQTVVLQADSKIRAQQMLQILNDYDIDVPIVSKDKIKPKSIQIVVDSFAKGFNFPSIDLVYLTERELFNQKPQRKKRFKTLENAQRLRNYTDLKPGDYVVHVNHGIGRFEGIKTLEVDGNKRDYITITYQHHDQLFVPADQLGLVQKYVASEGRVPHVNKLGGSEWAKTKQRVQSKIEDIADDLIELYAQRESEKGFAFSHDDELQNQFESSFSYVETPDQVRSIKEIKSDMERSRPMDRLLVGDVGFGKTEVALRAAFKAVAAGKQVAFLVPTTILAQQHFETMQARFKEFPINVAMLSRFQTDAQAKEIVKKLASGEVDIVVGTHRILSKDVVFKDLGLLIVDEEQRFGVKHKERLKQLKSNVDVLTLTATPIPRTLHMSMVGVRDLSVMETPPTNRYPIQTYVMEESSDIIRQACLRELKRNGQVFFVHNRINDIDKVVSQLQELMPEAKIEFIHGRMSENQLEDIMYRFVQNEFDILVTTTIIETGVDLPNVNTLIVENADRYGLSQLYQLRGRIGRSARLAYAYFLYQPNKVLTEVGEKRLSAIRDFTQLGSGFKIAMRDLSIRGAGNMLGKQQHGFIDSVGYDLYSQMLDNAIKKKRGQKAVIKTNAEVQLDLEAYIPDQYISDQKQKIEFYKKIKTISNSKEVEDISDELIDRFGDYPVAVENLLNIAALKVEADLAQVIAVIRKKDKIQIIFSNKATQELEGPNIFKALEHVSLRARVNTDQQSRLNVILELEKDIKSRKLFAELHELLLSAGSIIQR